MSTAALGLGKRLRRPGAPLEYGVVKIALIQQTASHEKADNVRRGLAALETAARGGAQLVAFAELAFERFYPQRRAEPQPWRLGEPVPGPTTEAFCRRARDLGIVVVLNLYETDGRRGKTQDRQPAAAGHHFFAPVFTRDGENHSA